MFNLERNKQNLVIGRFRKNVSKFVRQSFHHHGHVPNQFDQQHQVHVVVRMT